MMAKLLKASLPSVAKNGKNTHRVLALSGHLIDTSGEKWNLAYGKSINFQKFPVPEGAVLDAVQEHLRNLIRSTSSYYVENQFNNLKRLFRVAKSAGVAVDDPQTYRDEFYVKVKRALSQSPGISVGTTANTLDAFRRWYGFCVDSEFEEFDEEYATYLEGQVIGGNPKGQAVLSWAPNAGPLRRYELAALQAHLQDDVQSGPDSLDDFLIVWMSLSYGIYPAALQYLNEEDLIRTIRPDGVVDYEIKIPRLKKRGIPLRKQFRVRPVDPRVGALFEQKIAENRAFRESLIGWNIAGMQHPIFSSFPSNVAAEFREHALRYPKAWFLERLQDYVLQAGLAAIDGSPLQVTFRRFRYSFATRMIQEGASSIQLADALDHSDLQSVLVYFNSRLDAIPSIDAALGRPLTPIAQIFLGEIVQNMSEAIRAADPNSHVYYISRNDRERESAGKCGKFSYCGLYAPLACYTCRKFRAWLEGPHEKVLAELLMEREDLLKRGVDLKIVSANDVTIYAVREVIARCAAILSKNSTDENSKEIA